MLPCDTVGNSNAKGIFPATEASLKTAPFLQSFLPKHNKMSPSSMSQGKCAVSERSLVHACSHHGHFPSAATHHCVPAPQFIVKMGIVIFSFKKENVCVKGEDALLHNNAPAPWIKIKKKTMERSFPQRKYESILFRKLLTAGTHALNTGQNPKAGEASYLRKHP